ncbi:hypothetical protein PVAND_000985 [Polypedilum vanderplanki]|uniref:IQ and ubiquitin-like domain-containing protein n=1 Tax=Polypedilum vanderplanki TaxID=319348 RepID=A0A9J6BLZ0_POLVA|nr:hypothetical protein PVAND_000985 [Polypedilum vanderplanki]
MSGAIEAINPITVKIKLDENVENTIAVNFPQSFNVGNLKEDISKKFNVDTKSLLVYQHEEEIENDQMLASLLLNDFGIVEIKLKLTEEATLAGEKLDINVYYSSFTLPDIITVHIPTTNEEGETVMKDLVVEIENKAIKKPFLGGFVHKKTKIEYHHAITQTGPTIDQIEKLKEKTCTRDTQTAKLLQISTDTTKDQATQHFGSATESIYQPTKNDSEIEANKNYETSEQRDKRINLFGAVELIQRNFRRVRLNQCIKSCAAEYRRLQAIKKKQEDRLKQDYINSNRKSENFPRTKKDFDLLFAQIAAWKEAERRKIQENFTGPSRIVELQALLEKEIQLLNGIESRKIEIREDMQISREDNVLARISEPIKWLGYNSKFHTFWPGSFTRPLGAFFEKKSLGV